MKKHLIIFCSFVLLILGLTSCGVGKTSTVKPVTPNHPTDPENPNNPQDPNDPEQPGPDDPTPPEEIEYTVCLKNGDNLITPTIEVIVTWYSYTSNEQKSVPIGTDGYARVKGLDGEYGVHLSATPAGTTYNPNIYIASNDNPNVEIQLTLYQPISNSAGTGLYGKSICPLVVGTTYRISLVKQQPVIDVSNYRYRDSQKGIKYFKFEAKFDDSTREGTYVIESHADLYDDNINPYVITYGYANGNFINTDQPVIQNEGGAAKKGGYTKNFKFYVSYSKENTLGNNIFAFAIIAESKTNEYPISFDFSVKYYSDEEPDDPHVPSKMMYVTQETKDAFAKIGGRTPENLTGKFIPNMTVGNTLTSANVYLNETDGFWHYRLGLTPSASDPYLCAYITIPNAYIDKGFNHLEDEGPALTVSDGTEYYRDYFYLEGDERGIQYYTNTQGYCYVTKELQEVIQKVSVGQRYFMDGNGWIETTSNVYAAEADQWLYACCYFLPE